MTPDANASIVVGKDRSQKEGKRLILMLNGSLTPSYICDYKLVSNHAFNTIEDSVSKPGWKLCPSVCRFIDLKLTHNYEYDVWYGSLSG